MTEPALAIADAVVTALNAHTFPVPFQAERLYAFSRVFVNSDDLKATVMPVDFDDDGENGTRATDDERHRIGIALHKKQTNKSPAAVDPLVNLVRAVHDFCRSKEFAGATVMKRRTKSFDYDELKRNQFVGYVELELMYFYTPEEA